MRKVSDKSSRGNQNPHLCSIRVFFPENRALYEIMWRDIVERGRTQMTDGACADCMLANKGYTHSHYVIFITLPLQQWVDESTCMLYVHSNAHKVIGGFF
jgi:hypothetical protein